MQTQTNSCGRFSPNIPIQTKCRPSQASHIFCVLRPHLGQSNASPSLLDDRHWRHAAQTLWKQGLKCCKDTVSCPASPPPSQRRTRIPLRNGKWLSIYFMQGIHKRLLEHTSIGDSEVSPWIWKPTELSVTHTNKNKVSKIFQPSDLGCEKRPMKALEISWTTGPLDLSLTKSTSGSANFNSHFVEHDLNILHSNNQVKLHRPIWVFSKIQLQTIQPKSKTQPFWSQKTFLTPNWFTAYPIKYRRRNKAS